MTESGNSSSVSITPEFISDRYSKPVWKVFVNDSEKVDAILEKIELGFGSDMSSATFYLPRAIDSANLPLEDDTVDIIVNGKLLFSGVIRVVTKHLGIDGQKVTYTCLSNLSKLNNTTVIYGNVANASAKNLLINLLHIPVVNGPPTTTGNIDVTDQTMLEAAESILAKVGNYKLNYNMVNGTYDVYKLGTGGTNTRSFLFGKNIVTYDVTKNTENVVDKVIVIGAVGDFRRMTPLNPSSLQLGESPSGKRQLFFTLPIGARDVVIEGLGNQQPKVTFSNYVRVSKKMLHGFDSSDIPGDSFKLALDDSLGSPDKGEDEELKPAVISHETFQAEWSQIGTEIKAQGTAQVVYLSDLPKMWQANFVNGFVNNSEAGIDKDKDGNDLSTEEINTGTTELEIMDDPDFTWTIGALRVTYTTDSTAPSTSVGTGDVYRSMTDSQYKVVTDTTTGQSNQGLISSLMNLRAQAEYEKLHIPAISGNITVLGDETITLEQTIIAENETLDILHVTHNFENGFSTTVTLTNEKFIPQLNLLGTVQRTKTVDTERDRRRNLLIEHINSELLSKLDKQKNGDDKPLLSSKKEYKGAFYKK